MQEPSFNPSPEHGGEYGTILKELSSNAKDLIQSEMGVFRDEMQSVLPRIAKHSTRAAFFGALCAISVFPFLAFIVIGLGQIMSDNYWLSALIVAIVCAAVGAPLAIRAFQKIKDEDVHFYRTRDGIARGANSVQEKVKKVIDTAKGESHGTRQYH